MDRPLDVVGAGNEGRLQAVAVVKVGFEEGEEEAPGEVPEWFRFVVFSVYVAQETPGGAGEGEARGELGLLGGNAGVSSR